MMKTFNKIKYEINDWNTMYYNSNRYIILYIPLFLIMECCTNCKDNANILELTTWAYELNGKYNEIHFNEDYFYDYSDNGIHVVRQYELVDNRVIVFRDSTFDGVFIKDIKWRKNSFVGKFFDEEIVFHKVNIDACTLDKIDWDSPNDKRCFNLAFHRRTIECVESGKIHIDTNHLLYGPIIDIQGHGIK